MRRGKGVKEFGRRRFGVDGAGMARPELRGRKCRYSAFWTLRDGCVGDGAHWFGTLVRDTIGSGTLVRAHWFGVTVIYQGLSKQPARYSGNASNSKICRCRYSARILLNGQVKVNNMDVYGLSEVSAVGMPRAVAGG